ncbi:hypothetical protein ED733_000331 [Metarhizium rileyi]|uniref:Uncharacterized protein n=1 Tax=Metarhizium rileyi (strain RCEF 4871) TaxID=1649241 RepID=A0A5C6G2F2_METRR|nr:hypothetical protein ED733_000331 [Metarhizium rileyi]
MRFTFGRSHKGYCALPQYEDEPASLTKAPSNRSSKLGKLTKYVLGGFALLAAAGLTAQSLVPSIHDDIGYHSDEGLRPDRVLNTQQLQTLQSNNRSVPVGGDRRLRIFMHADSPHINLCKSTMSAVAMGYPPPILLNWGGEFNRPGWHRAGSHTAKLESFLSVIENMLSLAEGDDGDVHQDDLAVLVDAHDTWFQLPPSVLIQRYHQLNREADDRVRRQWEDAQGFGTGFPIYPPKQSIIVTTAKDCHPKGDSRSDPHYSHWPESPTPSDMYGDTTNKVLAKPSDSTPEFTNVQPRCINSDMTMGTMASLRDALIRARAKIDIVSHRGRQLCGDQGLLGEVVGEQEMWREWMRELGTTWNGTASESHLPRLPRDVRRVAESALKGERFEYGIGIDDSFSTITAACSASETNHSFVKMNDQEAPETGPAKTGVPPGQVRGKAASAELVQVNVGPEHLSSIDWRSLSLYADFHLGVVPVGIHHTTCANNPESTRPHQWWSKMWFYPQLRRLVAQAMLPLGAKNPIQPLARTPAPHEGDQATKYWMPKSDLRNRMVKVFEPAPIDVKSGGSLTAIEWDGVCQQSGRKPWHEELFGDKKGPWQL